ncbi:MAG: response regulator, partial [Rhodobacteraceae bacterium]|nr:response regulator [Paracoccaceae bacterium]
MRILLVEDDPATAQAVSAMLKKSDWVVDTADMGEDGLDLGKVYEYDLIIVDLMLPDMDGMDVIRQLRNSRVETPVLILSGLTQPEKKVQGFGLGADDYLTKP